MDILYPRCAGLDVHKDSVVAAVRIVAKGVAGTEVRTFGTATPDLLAPSARLAGTAAPMSPWRRPGSTGSRSGTPCRTATSR